MSTALPEPAHRLIRSFTAARRNKWSHSHLYNSVTALNRLQRWLADQELGLLEAGPDELNEFIAWRLATPKANGQPRRANSVIAERTILSAFYRWAAADPGDGAPYIARNPMLRVPAPKGEEDADPANVPEATDADYRALAGTCQGRRTRDGDRRAVDRRDATILALLWYVGMRAGELVGIRYEDIDFATQMVHLRRTKGRTKTRNRNVYIPDEAMQILDRYLHERGDHDGSLIESTRRDPTGARLPLAAAAIRQMIERRAALAGAGLHAPPHSFRRGFAAAWMEGGGSQVALEDHQGWKHDGRMAGRYTRRSSTLIAAEEARRVAAVRRSRLRVV